MQGKILGDRYQIETLIGEGGMANIYRAVDLKLKKRVAVKVLLEHWSKYEGIRQRFQLEAEAISSIEHPNIIKVYDFSGVDSPTLWMVTEILSGKNLGQFLESLRSNKLHPVLSCLVISEVCKALEKAHSNGIVHRDIKPDNIMVSRSGKIVLMDFGIAKDTHRSDMTMAGTLMGSPSYMSPEQVKCQPVDYRTDIFSLGVTLYETLTGVLPFSGKNSNEIGKNILSGEYVEPKDLLKINLPSKVNGAIVRAMQSNPLNRFQKITHFQKEIRSFLDQYGFEESHIELERFFRDRDSFNIKLEKLNAIFQNNNQMLPEDKINKIRQKPRLQSGTKLKIANNEYDFHEKKTSHKINYQSKDRKETGATHLKSENPVNKQEEKQQVVVKVIQQSPEPIKIIQQASNDQKNNNISNKEGVENFKNPRQSIYMPSKQERNRKAFKNVVYTQHNNQKDFISSFVIGLIVISASLFFATFGYQKLDNNMTFLYQKYFSEEQKSVSKKSYSQRQKLIKQRESQEPSTEKIIAQQNKVKKKFPKKVASIIKRPTRRLTRVAAVEPASRNFIQNNSRILPEVKTLPLLKIKSRPAARIYINGKLAGTTNSKKVLKYGLSLSQGKHRIELRRSGFKTWTETLSLKKGDEIPLNINLKNITKDVKFTIYSNRVPAQISIINLESQDFDSYVMTNSTEVLTLFPGKYQIKVNWNNQAIERIVKLDKNRRQLTFNAEF
ncbi:MAG: hypothetical protein CMP10_21455 [Zetaproteobacteria bacterium]|nr:hypothetical protein [Pseudobdellovibrionaceae bacterium]